MENPQVDVTVGERIHKRLERNGGTKRDRFLVQDLQARSLAIACDLDHPEGIRHAAQYMAAQFALLLHRAETIREGRRSARAQRRPRVVLGKLPSPRVRTAARGITVQFCVRLGWLKERARSEHDLVAEYLGLPGERIGPFEIFSRRELRRLDDFEEELRGAAWHQLKIIANSITDEQRRELAALAWYGRGDGPLHYCRQHATTIDPHVSYIFDKPIDVYLPHALHKLDLLCDDGGEA